MFSRLACLRQWFLLVVVGFNITGLSGLHTFYLDSQWLTVKKASRENSLWTFLLHSEPFAVEQMEIWSISHKLSESRRRLAREATGTPWIFRSCHTRCALLHLSRQKSNLLVHQLRCITWRASAHHAASARPAWHHAGGGSSEGLMPSLRKGWG